MKQNNINTEINVPRWGDENNDFIKAMLPFLELPEDWDKYLRFSNSSDFITLQSKEGYKATMFRRFKRYSKASFPEKLKSDLREYIAYKKESIVHSKGIEERNEYYRELVKDIVRNANIPCFHVVYESDTNIEKSGIRIELTNGKTEYISREILGEIYIRHSGNISNPAFSHHFGRYGKVSIEAAAQWIEANKAAGITLLSKAVEIKNQLPSEFFTPETVTA